MKGIGWQCDQCGKMVLAPGDMFMVAGRPAPPKGWWVLVGPMGSDPNAAAVELHMCPDYCVSMHQPERLPQFVGVDDFGISDLTAQEFGRKVMARVNALEPAERAAIGNKIIGKTWSDWSSRIAGES